jgi:hypothetical protein
MFRSRLQNRRQPRDGKPQLRIKLAVPLSLVLGLPGRPVPAAALARRPASEDKTKGDRR